MPTALTEREKKYVHEALRASEGTAFILNVVFLSRMAQKDPFEVQGELTEIKVGIQQCFRDFGKVMMEKIDPKGPVPPVGYE